ncbi:MAG TPA: hypothetical protein VMM76_20655 [Pirellulaceae bacterium]|nr:hypothetical protein [Pirellulaceae bacterium]
MQSTQSSSGFSVDELRECIAGRKIHLWGASIVGFGMLRALQRNGFQPVGFLDKSPRLQQTGTLGFPVLAPDWLLNNLSRREKSFVVVTSGHYEDEIVGLCEEAGMRRGVDFLTANEINRYDPSVDVAGMCNLRCISCPRGNMEDQGATGFMRIDTYEKVVAKLLREIPFLGSIQLYAWGEPLLNRDLPAMIRTTVDRQILLAISTNLNIKRDFSDVIEAKPDWIKVSTSGFGRGYEISHTGGNWELLHDNLYKLRDHRARFHPEMYVEVNYHMYRRNAGDELKRMESLCSKLGFAFRPNQAYLYPLDHVMAYRKGEPIPKAAQDTIDMLMLPIDEGIALAEQEAHLPCAEERCVPIAWDLSVRSCGAYFKPRMADNFLETPLEEIIQTRIDSGICDRCKAQALHRYTSVYVREKISLSPELRKEVEVTCKD